MRVIKQRLLEMVPEFSIFLDVDDLEDIANLPSYVDWPLCRSWFAGFPLVVHGDEILDVLPI